MSEQTALPAEAPSWMEFPEDKIETPYGPMRVIFNGELMFDTSLQRNGSNEERGGLVINQVRYHGSIGLAERNGTWGYTSTNNHGQPTRYSSVYLTRADWVTAGISYNNSGLSEAAGKKIDKLVQDVLIPYALSHKEQIEQGRRAQASHGLQSVYNDLTEARAKLAALETKAAELWKRYEGK